MTPEYVERLQDLHGQGGTRGQGQDELDRRRLDPRRRPHGVRLRRARPVPNRSRSSTTSSAFQGRVAQGRRWSIRSRRSLMKLASPGVPDIYQGCELWDLSLVDPGQPTAGRLRPCGPQLLGDPEGVGSTRRETIGRRSLASSLLGSPDRRARSSSISIGRRARATVGNGPAVYSTGAPIIPLAKPRGRTPTAIARLRPRMARAMAAVIVAAPRLVASMMGRRRRTAAGWRRPGKSTSLVIPPELASGFSWQDRLTGTRHRASRDEPGGKRILPLAEVFARLPVGLLVGRRGINSRVD